MDFNLHAREAVRGLYQAIKSATYRITEDAFALTLPILTSTRFLHSVTTHSKRQIAPFPTGNGDFVCLGIMSEERIPTLPEFPTFVEQGYNVVADKRYSFSFPKGTEDAIIAKLNEAFAVIAVDPEFIADVESYNGTVHYTNPEETYAYESATVERFRELFAKSTH